MKIFKKLLLPGIFLLLTSCNPVFLPFHFENTRMDQVIIEVLQPAEKKIDQTLKNALLLTREPGKSIDIAVQGDVIFWDTLPLEIQKAFVQNTTASLQQMLNDGPRFTAKDTSGFFFGDIGNLAWSEIDNICKNSGVDGIILLDRQETKVNSDIALEYSSDFYAEDIHGANLKVEVETTWKIYNPLKREIKRYPVKISDAYYSRGYTVNEALEGLPSFEEILDRFSFLSGEKYGGIISPVWATANRYYYVAGNRALKTAAKLMKEGKWDEAFIIWRNHTEDPNIVVAKHASFNTILSYEIEGDLKSALMWANNTSIRFNSIEAKSYAELLSKRLEEKKIIDEQMGW